MVRQLQSRGCGGSGSSGGGRNCGEDGGMDCDDADHETPYPPPKRMRGSMGEGVGEYDIINSNDFGSSDSSNGNTSNGNTSNGNTSSSNSNTSNSSSSKINCTGGDTSFKRKFATPSKPDHE